MVDTLGMSEEYEIAVDAAQKGRCSMEQAEAYVFAVEVLRNALLLLQLEPSSNGKNK